MKKKLKPTEWATQEELSKAAKIATAEDIVELLRFADIVDALMIDETRKVLSGFSVRDARNNLLKSSESMHHLRQMVTKRIIGKKQ